MTSCRPTSTCILAHPADLAGVLSSNVTEQVALLFGAVRAVLTREAGLLAALHATMTTQTLAILVLTTAPLTCVYPSSTT